MDSQKHFQIELGAIEAQLIQAQLNPHFTFNALNSINHLVLNQELDKASTYLVKFAQLLRKQLDFAIQQSIRMSDELDMIRLYLNLEALRFSEAFEWNIEVSPDLNPNALYLPPMLLQPYVENAVWHGLLPKNGHKLLTIKVTSANADYFLISIADNGIGMEASAKLKSANQQDYASMGMLLGQKRMAMLAFEDSEARVEVVHPKAHDYAFSGTEIKLYLRKRTSLSK